MVVENGAPVVILDVVDNLAHHFVGVPAVIAGAGDADRQRLPAILVGYLGDRNIETAADTLHQWKMSSHVPTTMSCHKDT